MSPGREVEDCADAIAHIYEPWGCEFFFDSVDQPGFEHFLAYENRTPVSAAILGTHGDFAYLGWAGTAEEHRGKGRAECAYKGASESSRRTRMSNRL